MVNNGNGHSAQPVNGRRLAYELRGLTARQRAAWAHHYAGRVFTGLTARQLCGLFNVGAATLAEARNRANGKPSNVERRLERLMRKVGSERAWNALVSIL
jgi:hypothetical protein